MATESIIHYDIKFASKIGNLDSSKDKILSK